jgi:hypothetical protein
MTGCKQLESVSFTKCHIDSEKGEHFFSKLIEISSLKHLNLSRNQMKAVALLMMLNQHPSLESLNLSYNNLYNE